MHDTYDSRDWMSYKLGTCNGLDIYNLFFSAKEGQDYSNGKKHVEFFETPRCTVLPLNLLYLKLFPEEVLEGKDLAGEDTPAR